MTIMAIGVAFWLGTGLPGAAARADEGLPGPANGTVLTQSEAVRLVLDRSRELRVLAGEESAQEREVEAAATSFHDPQLRLEDLSTRYADPDANKQITVGLRWQPPRLGELPAAEQKERVLLWAKKVTARALRARLAAQARKEYAEQALLRDSRRLSAARVGLEERRLAAVEALVALGQRPLLDRVRSMRRLVKARRDDARLRQRLADGAERLSGLTGVAGDVELSLGAPPELDLDFPAVHRVAVEHRPEVGLAEQRSRLADREYSAERLRLMPWFSFLEVGYVHETEKPDWGEFRIGIDLPFSRWNLSHLRAAATARQANAHAGAGAVEAVDRDVAQALARYREALAALRELRADDGNLQATTRDLLAAVRRDPTLAADDVVDLELAELDERQMALDARYDLEAAAADLCVAAGVERWEDLLP
jgi:outer membrane protein TolC